MSICSGVILVCVIKTPNPIGLAEVFLANGATTLKEHKAWMVNLPGGRPDVVDVATDEIVLWRWLTRSRDAVELVSVPKVMEHVAAIQQWAEDWSSSTRLSDAKILSYRISLCAGSE